MKKKDREILRKRKALIKSVKPMRRRFVKLTCKKCKQIFSINANNRDIYSVTVRKNWLCLSCHQKREK